MLPEIAFNLFFDSISKLRPRIFRHVFENKIIANSYGSIFESTNSFNSYCVVLFHESFSHVMNKSMTMLHKLLMNYTKPKQEASARQQWLCRSFTRRGINASYSPARPALINVIAIAGLYATFFKHCPQDARILRWNNDRVETWGSSMYVEVEIRPRSMTKATLKSMHCTTLGRSSNAGLLVKKATIFNY
jgi:hypothetical protein